MNPLEWSLLYGGFPTALGVSGGVALAYLVARRKRRWVTVVTPLVVGISVVIVILVAWLVNDIWHPLPDPLPETVLVWTGVTSTAIGLGVARLRSSGWVGRAAVLVAVVLVVLSSLNHVNTFFGYYPNLRDTLGLSLPNESTAAKVLGRSVNGIAPEAGSPLSSRWHPPSDMPSAGKVVEVAIPGTVSGFKGRDAWLYLPPAYLTSSRPRLPVLELLEGQPGTTRDWLNGGNLTATMDAYANAHEGLAPIVIMPDDLGSFWGNPLCINSDLGQSDTYLTVDVPKWVERNLAVDDNTAYWAVAGASYGGTCAWQFAVLHPKLFPTFIDIAGVFQQARGTLAETVDAAFGGNYRKFAKVNPVQILVNHTRPDSWGTIAVGIGDTEFVADAVRTATESRRAGMHIRLIEAEGGHSYELWASLLAGSMDWLGTRMGITG